MSRVYISQESNGKNFLPAKQFGDLVVLLSINEGKNPMDVIWDKITERLRGARPHDYILLVGDPLIMSLSLAAILEITGGEINVLKWERMKYEYRVVKLDNNVWRK